MAEMGLRERSGQAVQSELETALLGTVPGGGQGTDAATENARCRALTRHNNAVAPYISRPPASTGKHAISGARPAADRRCQRVHPAATRAALTLTYHSTF